MSISLNSKDSDYRKVLLEHFSIRKEFNPNYSLRSFAKFLNIPSPNLSNILNEKQGLSKSSAEAIADKLKLSSEEKNKFVDMVLAKDARSKKEKLLALKRLEESQPQKKAVLREDHFRVISDWHYFAILELMTLKDFQSSHSWISNKLGLSESLVEQSMERLVRLELVKKVDGNYISTGAQLRAESSLVPSFSIQKHNLQLLAKASEAITRQDLDQREIATLTIAFNEEDIPYVKERIQKFQNELNKELMERSKKKGANRVYALAVQFFDLLKGKDNED